jgi:hypothetical protein
MMRRILLLFTLLGAHLISGAQPSSMKLDSLSACPGDTVVYYLEATNLMNIGAITLYITYDSSSLTYLGHQIAISGLAGLLSNAMTQPQVQVGISWSASMSGVNIGSDTMLLLKFRHKGGHSDLHFTNQCEVADYQANILNCAYVDGKMYHQLPDITQQPQSQTIQLSQMQSTSFNIALGVPAQYQWQIDTSGNNIWFDIPTSSPYLSGVNTSTLTITNINPGIIVFDSCSFRCRITSCGVQYSQTALLKIVDDTGIKEDNEGDFVVYPNPASSEGIFIISKEAPKESLYYSISDASGRIIHQSLLGSDSPFFIPVSNLQAGLYYLKISSKSSLISTHSIVVTP